VTSLNDAAPIKEKNETIKDTTEVPITSYSQYLTRYFNSGALTENCNDPKTIGAELALSTLRIISGRSIAK